MTEINPWAQAWQAASLPSTLPRTRKPPLVQNLVVQAGAASARIHEGKSVRPVHVHLGFPAPSSAEWRGLLLHRGLVPYALGLLFAQECPTALFEAFDRAHIPLVADPEAVAVSCSCPGNTWCKHAAGLWSRLGQEIERQPLTLLRLMGLDETVLGQIFEELLEAFPFVDAEERSAPLQPDAANFWGTTEPLPIQPRPDHSLPPSASLLQQMGAPLFWPKDSGLDRYLRPTYENARTLAELRNPVREEAPMPQGQAPLATSGPDQ